MARNKATLQNIDLSNTSDYLNGRIKDNTGGGDGTPVNEFVYGDFHQTMAKLMQLAGLVYNNLPDNETNGYQLVDAIRQLASKNDFSYELSSSGGNLTIPLRISKLTNNEIIRAKSTVNKGSETQIRGTLDNNNKSVTYLGDFKTNEYVRLINLSNSILVIREVDAFNINSICEDLGFLKGASDTEVLDDTIDDKALTPQSFLNAFIELINGNISDDYLANTTQNGLLSKEFWDIINGIGTPALRNRGDFILGDVLGNPTGTNYVSNGDITATRKGQIGNGDIVEISFNNNMEDTNYKIVTTIESVGTFNNDNSIFPIPFKPISTTKGEILVEETTSVTQNIKIHVDVIQL